MPIFRIIYYISLFSLGFAQQIDSILYADLEEKGAWKNYYILNDKSDYDFVTISAKIDSIHVRGDKSVQQKVLRSLFRPLLGLSNQNLVITQFRNINGAYSFLNNQSFVSFAQYGKKQVAAVINFHPQFKSQIGGILGASKGTDGKWLTTGEVDLHLENPRGKGTISDLEWRQPNDQSRFLNIAYEIPFPFGLPFGARAEFLQDFREDAYILESSSGMATSMGPFGRWMIGGKKESIHELVDQIDYNSESLILGVLGDQRNNRWLPYQGSYWGFEINLGRWEDHEGQSKVLEAEGNFGYYNLLKNSVLYFSFWAQGKRIDKRDLPLAKKVRFGGAGTLRGYYENQFNADWVVIQTTEWIFGDLSRSQIFLYTDIPFADGLSIKPGYGLGVRHYNGNLSLDIAAGFSSQSTGPKIHLKFSSNL